MPTDNRILRSAKWYASKMNWYVIPLYAPLFKNGVCAGCECELWKRRKNPHFVCDTPGKHPRLMDWEECATTNLAMIRAWWHKWPTSNVGIAAGKSGLLDLDLDKYKDDYDGDKVLTPEHEQTATNLSGGGGAHLIYQAPEDSHYTNARGSLPKGIDIRGWGGQFVVPPSIHPSGNSYRWETGYGPHEINLLPLPEEIAAILDAHQANVTALVKFEYDVEPPDFVNLHLKKDIVEIIHNPPAKGGRSEADQKVISALIKAGATDDEIKAIFTHYPIGKQGKFADKGANALRYLAHSIAHARGWLEEKRREFVEQNTVKFFQQVSFR